MRAKMKKALIYSLLIFPGAGFFILGRKPWGYACTVLATVIALLVVIDSVYKALAISENLVASLAQGGSISSSSLPELLLHLPAYVQAQMYAVPGLFSATVSTTLLVLLGIIWLIGIVGVYYVGRSTIDMESK